MKVTKENYVRLMQRGNEKALKYFIEQDGWIVKSIICTKMSAYRDSQEECMNDVFLAIWRNVGKYDEGRAAFTTWVAAITRYVILNYMRKLKRKMYEEDISVLDIIGEEDVAYQDYDEEAEFQELLHCLNEEDREIFTRLFLYEQSREEISRETGISTSRLYNKISRGKKKLRRSLLEDRSDEGCF